MRAVRAVSICAFVFPVACAKDAPGGTADSGAAPASSTVPVASGSANAAGSAAVAASASARAQAGSASNWSGTYKASKGTMAVPEGVKFHSDDSTAGVGDGTITLSIDPSGRMTGTSSGVLGDLSISGMDRGGEFAASLRPAAADGFTGTFIGSEPPAGGTTLSGTMNLSDGKNELVRTATVQLAKK